MSTEKVTRPHKPNFSLSDSTLILQLAKQNLEKLFGINFQMYLPTKIRWMFGNPSRIRLIR